MIRTQIYLPASLHQKLHSLSKSTGLSAAQIIRDALSRTLASGAPDNGFSELGELKLSGGPTDLSKDLDRYLYK
jgi:hypothetical protein